MVVQGLFGDMTSFRLSAAIMDRHQYLLRLSGEGSPDLALMPYAFTFPYFDQEAARAFNYAGVGSKVAEGLSRLFVDAYIGPRRVGKVVNEFFACMEKSIPNKAYWRLVFRLHPCALCGFDVCSAPVEAAKYDCASSFSERRNKQEAYLKQLI
ncbi:hypothetical protein V5799_032193 [Amblyomma americanum]|uniref:Uncharacterized protein n=1 Tax=Amblyomma americanum TaxID=6943 RepID=A0AAQ4DRV6_AMBAM